MYLICHGTVTLSEAFSNITGGDKSLKKPEEFFCLQCVVLPSDDVLDDSATKAFCAALLSA